MSVVDLFSVSPSPHVIPVVLAGLLLAFMAVLGAREIRDEEAGSP